MDTCVLKAAPSGYWAYAAKTRPDSAAQSLGSLSGEPDKEFQLKTQFLQRSSAFYGLRSVADLLHLIQAIEMRV